MLLIYLYICILYSIIGNIGTMCVYIYIYIYIYICIYNGRAHLFEHGGREGEVDAPVLARRYLFVRLASTSISIVVVSILVSVVVCYNYL